MKKSHKTAGLLFLTLMTLIMAGTYFLYRDYRLFLSTPITKEPQSFYLTIKSGTGFSGLVHELSRRNLLNSPGYLKWYAKTENLARRLKAGQYHFPAVPTPVQLLEKLVRGEVIRYRLTIPEGWTFQQMLTAIQQHPRISITLDGLTDKVIMERLGYPEKHPEGLFYPDTYLFPDKMTDADFLRRAYDTMQRIIEEEWRNRSHDTETRTPYEALILASIVEKETGVEYERAKIAGVFNRRIKKGMRLQTDPTVIYGMGSTFKGNIRRKDLRKDTPYNTYTRFGLPPTPIALPGRAAIRAALHPEKGDALYFVAKGDGSHQFSATLKEHNRAVTRYQLNNE